MKAITSYLPVYDECFSPGLKPNAILDKLQKAKLGPDFKIIAPKPAAPFLGWLASPILFFLYPAQSSFAKRCFAKLHPSHLDKIRKMDQLEVENQGTHYTREVAIEKNGVCYRGLMMGRKDCIANGKWILQAMGRDCPIERAARKCRSVYSEAGFNVLMINGPSIGRSQGVATPRTLGEAQEAGLCFLESALKAKQIAIAGHSMGGAVIGQAILQHQFKDSVKYLVVRQSAFDRVSNAVNDYVLCFKDVAKKMILANALEMDNVAVSKKLQRLGIHEIIIQTGNREIEPGTIPLLEDFASDGVIGAKSSLGYRLVKEGIIRHKTFVCIPGLNHFESDKYLKASSGLSQKFFK